MLIRVMLPHSNRQLHNSLRSALPGEYPWAVQTVFLVPSANLLRAWQLHPFHQSCCHQPIRLRRIFPFSPLYSASI